MSKLMKMFCLLLLLSGVALADDAALLRCRTIVEPTGRLACYDALVLPANSAVSPTIGADRVAAQPLAGTPAASTQQKPSQFGFEERLVAKNELDAIESYIPGSFEGWSDRSNIKLANGQVWQISDNSSRAHYFDNPKVKIRRGALGSFYLEIQGTNISPRVKRVQ